ncbi:MAG: pilus assembly protein CpaA [Clostridiales bacterium]|nr:pilus assembly protein CpaA [Clostridiales bacterium]
MMAVEKSDMVRGIFFWVFLLAAAWQDFRSKSIAVWMFVIFGAAGFILNLVERVSPLYFCGSVVGISMLVAGAGLKGAVGAGDGCFFVVSGLFLGLTENARLFCIALLLSGIYGLGIYVYKRLRYGLNAGKEIFPFLPFVVAGELLLLLLDM